MVPTAPARFRARAARVLLGLTDAGLYCAAGDFHIDPWRPVPRAVITHAHGDHARSGSEAYLAADAGMPLLRARLGDDAHIEAVAYGERVRIGEVNVSLHPAGHVLGSSQVRIASRNEVTVVSGDYKLAFDPTCAAFEPVACDTFVSESTFGLPIYRWDEPAVTASAIVAWWNENAREGRASVLLAYALGKAQRVLASIGADAPGPFWCHGAVARINGAYAAAGVSLPLVRRVAEAPAGTRFGDALILAPPSVQGSTWLRRFEPYSLAFASGWMAIRGARRRANYDRGFAFSDHADWPALNAAVEAANPQRVWVTHGYSDEFARWLVEQGRDAIAVETRFAGEPIATEHDATVAGES